MSSSTLVNDYVGLGSHAARPVIPNISVGASAVYRETDTGQTFIWDGSAWQSVAGFEADIGSPADDDFLAYHSATSLWTNRTHTAATALLDAMVGDTGSGGTKGLAPAPGVGDAAAGKFLKADGTFAVPSGTGLGGTLSAGHIFVGNSGGVATDVAMTGDVSITSGGVTALAATTVVAGSYSTADITVDAKGRVTSASTGSGGSGLALSGGHVFVGNSGGVAADVAMTGDVTITSGGVTAIGANKVANAQLAQMGGHTYKGNITGLSADPADLTATQLTAELNTVVGDTGSGGTKGMVPAPGAGDAAGGKFLKADGTFAVPSGTGLGGALSAGHVFVGNSAGVATDVAVTGDVSITSGGVTAIGANKVTNAQLATMGGHTHKGNNTGVSGNPLDLTAAQLTADLDAMVGDTGTGGTKGLVPAPGAGDGTAAKYLKADGSWAVPAGTGLGGTLSAGHIFVGNSGGVAIDVAMTGDVSITSGGVTALAATTVAAGSYTNANITVDAKGRLTSASTGSGGGGLSSTLSAGHIFVGNSGGVATDVAVSGDITLTSGGVVTLVDTAVTSGSYTAANITVDSKGRLTTASSGTNASAIQLPVSGTPTSLTINSVTFNGYPVTWVNPGANSISRYDLAFLVNDHTKDECSLIWINGSGNGYRCALGTDGNLVLFKFTASTSVVLGAINSGGSGAYTGPANGNKEMFTATVRVLGTSNTVFSMRAVGIEGIMFNHQDGTYDMATGMTFYVGSPATAAPTINGLWQSDLYTQPWRN